MDGSSFHMTRGSCLLPLGPLLFKNRFVKPDYQTCSRRAALVEVSSEETGLRKVFLSVHNSLLSNGQIFSLVIRLVWWDKPGRTLPSQKNGSCLLTFQLISEHL